MLLLSKDVFSSRLEVWPFYAPIVESQTESNHLRWHCLFETKTWFSFMDKHCVYRTTWLRGSCYEPSVMSAVMMAYVVGGNLSSLIFFSFGLWGFAFETWAYEIWVTYSPRCNVTGKGLWGFETPLLAAQILQPWLSTHTTPNLFATITTTEMTTDDYCSVCSNIIWLASCTNTILLYCLSLPRPPEHWGTMPPGKKTTAISTWSCVTKPVIAWNMH